MLYKQHFLNNNNRMNLFKSAFNSSKADSSHQSLEHVYQDVKSWDQSRAKSLQCHLKIIEVVMDALGKKVGQVQKYIEGLERLMIARIDQITTYYKNGVNDSQFFLVPCPLNAMKPTHQLLKHLLMEQSQRQLNLEKKASVLSEILEKLKQLKAQQCSQKAEGSERQGNTVSELKSRIRFLIDCQLPDLIQSVILSCKEVSSSYKEGKDFYWAIQKFVRKANAQLKMHSQIGSELLQLIEVFSKRQKKLRVHLREILSDWVKEDLEDKVFLEQLHKNKTDQLIDDYYDIENIAPEHSHLWQGGSLTEYLQKFRILPFTLHEKLVLYSRQVLYNGKIQAKIVLTEQKNIHLFRLQANEPDFTFGLNKNLKIKTQSSLSLEISQWKRVMLLRQEKQFGFTLEFNLEGDQEEFISKCKIMGCVVQK